MSFASRMTTDTQDRQPRWLYLLRKIVDTLAGGVALAAVTGWPPLWTTQTVALIYVGLGLWEWYRRRRIVLTLAPGQFPGDGLYHGVLSQAAVAFVLPTAPPIRLGLFLVGVVLWWVLEGMGYGVVRAPDAP